MKKINTKIPIQHRAGAENISDDTTAKSQVPYPLKVGTFHACDEKFKGTTREALCTFCGCCGGEEDKRSLSEHHMRVYDSNQVKRVPSADRLNWVRNIPIVLTR
eukprot:TRINITY_DN47123_c0_g1_i1.p1 TRINITY_DN47123_c0_g1~~TRINITY_DN47123_c0_g1_i1.p1  ORF type:complete len:104 (+),score=15.50 TRINITY_DN47123_c0_g1_i1:149-460(+)